MSWIQPTVRWSRAAMSLAIVWSVGGALTFLLVAVGRTLLGADRYSGRVFLFGGLVAAAFAAGAGLVFAIAISLLGRLRRSASITVGSGIGWGACAGTAAFAFL